MAGGKTLYVTDFDDTLVHTDARVILIDKDGKRRELSPAEYASYEKQDGDTFDFSEFEQLKNARPIKKYFNLLKRVLDEKRADKVVVLTARGHTRPIAQFLKNNGITSGVKIAALGSSDPMAKARYIEKHIEDGYNRVAFVDDAPKNVKAVKTLIDKHPDAKIVVRQVEEPDSKKTGETPTKEKRANQQVEVRPLETKDELQQAKDWIMKKHYIKRWPSAVQAKLGVYIGDKLEGVLLYGATIRPTSGTEIFRDSERKPIMQNNQMWELLRAYTTEESKKEVPNLGSMVIAKGNDYIRTKAKTKDGKPVKAILTYADSDVGHTGGVYKATNATFLGKQKPLPVFIVRNPKTEEQYELRTLTSLNKKKLEDAGMEISKRMGAGKYKYVYSLGKDQRERDELMAHLAVPMYDYPTGKEGEQQKEIPNPAKEKMVKKQTQPQQTPKSGGEVLKNFFQNAKVLNPDTGEEILVRSALKYDKQSKAYLAAKKSVDDFAKKHNVRIN